MGKHLGVSRWIRGVMVFALVLAVPVSLADNDPEDNPPTAQGVGEHSTIETSDGRVRDDELAEMIRDAINDSANDPTSIKVFFNSCYGGGMLDDLADLANELDIPFVGGSASDAEQPAWGPKDEMVGDSDMGSTWTDALEDAINDADQGDSVSGTTDTARDNDTTAPGGEYADNLPEDGEPENPQSTTANGGHDVNWGEGEGVVFSGNNTDKRHDNNVEKMEDSLDTILGDGAVRSSADTTNYGSSTSDLEDMIDDAMDDLDGSEEFVLYVDDHGNTEFDVDEWWESVTQNSIELDNATGWESTGPGSEQPVLHDGWENGLTLNVNQGDTVNPGMLLAGNFDSVDFPSGFPLSEFYETYYEIGAGPQTTITAPIFLPTPNEDVFVPMPWQDFEGGPFTVGFLPRGSVPPLTLSNLELTSGPINDIGFVPEPASLVLVLTGLVAVTTRRRPRA